MATDTVTAEGIDPEQGGWASDSVQRSLRQAVLLGLALWQVLLLLAMTVAPPRAGVWPVVAGAHVGLAVVSVAVERSRLPTWALVPTLPSVVLVDWLAATERNDVFGFAALWLFHGSQLVSTLALRGRQSVITALSLDAVVLAVVGIVRGWWLPVVIPAGLTAAGVQVGSRLLVRMFDDFAHAVDVEEDAHRRARQNLAQARAAIAEAAAQARTLHDTALHTLAAVANGGAAVRDAERVRERCRRDVAVLTALTVGRDPEPPVGEPPDAGPERRAGDDGTSDAVGVADPDAARFDEIVRAVRWRGCWLWTAGTVAIGVVIEQLSRPLTMSATYAMLAVVGGTGAASWAYLRRRRHLSPLAATLVAIGVAVSHVLAMAAVDFGRGDPTPWHAIGLVPLLVILYLFGPSGRYLVLGVVVLGVTSAVVAVGAGAEKTTTVAIVVGTWPALLVVAGWVVFDHQLERLGRRAAVRHGQAVAAELERAARDAAAAAGERWRRAGLAWCRALLEGIASGRLDPSDPEVRAASAVEEDFLRQVTTLDPELFRLGPRLASTLALARIRGVRLTVRTGGHDVESEATAELLGHLVRDLVGRVGSGTAVTVSLFASQGTLRFTLVGPVRAVTAVTEGWLPPAAWSLDVQVHGDVAIAELVTEYPSHSPAWTDAS